MRVDRIAACLALEKLESRVRWGPAGTIVQVKVPGKDFGVCALVPIDDDMDMKFVDSLIDTVRKYESGEYERGGYQDGESLREACAREVLPR